MFHFPPRSTVFVVYKVRKKFAASLIIPGVIMFHASKLMVILVLVFLAANPAEANTRVVSVVHSGDMVEIEGGWTSRITGIKAPALDAPFGREAHEFTRDAVEGERVVFSTWTTNSMPSGIVYDEDGIPFATIEYGGPRLDLGAELLKRGLARVDTNYLPEYHQEYVTIEAEAREAGAGLWRDVKSSE
jgi:endonuclease YncB( thermonuclease family)